MAKLKVLIRSKAELTLGLFLILMMLAILYHYRDELILIFIEHTMPTNGVRALIALGVTIVYALSFFNRLWRQLTANRN